MYQQIPTVITKVAAEGIPEIDNNSLIADNAEEFANKIIKLYIQKELWELYSTNGKQFIKNHFTENAAKKIIEKIIDEDSIHSEFISRL